MKSKKITLVFLAAAFVLGGCSLINPVKKAGNNSENQIEAQAKKTNSSVDISGGTYSKEDVMNNLKNSQEEKVEIRVENNDASLDALAKAQGSGNKKDCESLKEKNEQEACANFYRLNP